MLQSAKNQIDLGKEILRAPAQPSAPAQKTKTSLWKEWKVCAGRKFYEN